MWWKKPYINRRDWILENLGVLDLTPNQAMVVLMIDYMNEHRIVVSLESLAGRLALKASLVDEILHDLMRAHKVSIKVEAEAVVFNIDGLFETGVAYEYVNENIFEVFEAEFGRLLSQPELMMLNDWMAKYQEADILDALRSAMVYKKISMPYINSILANKAKERNGV